MPSTRSQSKQTHIDEPKVLKGAIATKRKAPETTTSSKRAKKSVSQEKDDKEDAIRDQDEDAITINRAPVLELWAACVTAFLYDDLQWTTCLSAGAAISTICAIAKGRAIGSIDKPTAEEAQKRRDERKEKSQDENVKELEVMGFDLSIQNGDALVSGKPKKVNESTLQHKYGEQYDKVKKSFETALHSWKGHEEELDSQAFHMYEDFRPTVPRGQKGWGRKGQLNLTTVQSVVEYSP